MYTVSRQFCIYRIISIHEWNRKIWHVPQLYCIVVNWGTRESIQNTFIRVHPNVSKYMRRDYIYGSGRLIFQQCYPCACLYLDTNHYPCGFAVLFQPQNSLGLGPYLGYHPISSSIISLKYSHIKFLKLDSHPTSYWREEVFPLIWTWYKATLQPLFDPLHNQDSSFSALPNSDILLNHLGLMGISVPEYLDLVCVMASDYKESQLSWSHLVLPEGNQSRLMFCIASATGNTVPK
jgi:hypothetical protein